MKKQYTKQIPFVAVLLATLTLIGGCGNQGPSDTANKSAPDTEVTTTRAASAAETPVVLTETQKIEKTTIIGDILDIAPQAAPLFFAIGMHCLGCPSSRGETVEEACMVHGVDCEPFLAQLNHFLEAYEASEAEKNA